MPHIIWEFFALLVSPKVLRINSATGYPEYPAIGISRQGGVFSYAMGLWTAPPSRALVSKTEPELLVNVAALATTFKEIPYFNTATLRDYTLLLCGLQNHEDVLRRLAASTDLERLREKGREQNYSHNQRRVPVRRSV